MQSFLIIICCQYDQSITSNTQRVNFPISFFNDLDLQLILECIDQIRKRKIIMPPQSLKLIWSCIEYWLETEHLVLTSHSEFNFGLCVSLSLIYCVNANNIKQEPPPTISFSELPARFPNFRGVVSLCAHCQLHEKKYFRQSEWNQQWMTVRWNSFTSQFYIISQILRNTMFEIFESWVHTLVAFNNKL